MPHLRAALPSPPFATPASAREPLPSFSGADRAPDPWRRPVTPFRIADRSWYIGARGLAAALVRTDEGEVLVDGGLGRLGGQPQTERRADR